jgi:hypothetical protein
LPEIKKRGYNVAALSYDSVEILKNFSDRKKLTYPLLSDSESKVIKGFGILNEGPKSGFAVGIPHPGVFVINALGKVEAKYFEEDYRERITMSAILSNQLGKPTLVAGDQVEGKNVRATPRASSLTARTGQHVVLSLTVQLPKGLHAYAAGAPSDYIQVDWKNEPNEGYRLGPLEAPTPKRLAVGGETVPVPVYEGEFTLKRDLIPGAAAKLKASLDEQGKLHVKSAFRYQVCSDRQCFPPQTVNVVWSLRGEQMETERVPVELRRK